MSGRIRSLKPEILEDAKTAGLTHLEFRLFVSLILLADDYGNLRAEQGMIRGAVFWAVADVSDAEVSAAMAVLEVKDLVSRYTVRGQAYAHIMGWERHQKVDRPGKPRVPSPPPREANHPTHLPSFATGSHLPREIAATLSRDTRETLANLSDVAIQGIATSQAVDIQEVSECGINSRDTRETLATDHEEGSRSRPGGGSGSGPEKPTIRENGHIETQSTHTSSIGPSRTLRPDEPLTPRRSDYVETVRTNTGEDIDAQASWSRFVNDRIEKSVLYASPESIDAGWRKWVDREAQFAKERRVRDRERERRAETRRPASVEGGASARARRLL